MMSCSYLGMSIRPQRLLINQDRINNLIDKICEYENFEDAKWLLDEPVVNFSQSVVDDTIKTNADFLSEAGFQEKIIRRQAGNCCKWCANLVGTYNYPDEVPKDVWRRHRFCKCTLDHVTEKGSKKVNNDWNEEKHKRKKRKEFSEKGKEKKNNSVKKLENHIRKELISKQKIDIVQGRQNKHIQGTNEYNIEKKKYIAKKEFGPGLITIDDNKIIELVNKYKGTGILRISKGQWQNVETIIDNDEIIGVVINNITGDKADTSVFKIHYSDKGVHISPDYPSKKRRNYES